jgi:hypothetical protein
MMCALSRSEFFGLKEGDLIEVTATFSARSRWYAARVVIPPVESPRPTLSCRITDENWRKDPDQYYSSDDLSRVRFPSQNT